LHLCWLTFTPAADAAGRHRRATLRRYFAVAAAAIFLLADIYARPPHIYAAFVTLIFTIRRAVIDDIFSLRHFQIVLMITDRLKIDFFSLIRHYGIVLPDLLLLPLSRRHAAATAGQAAIRPPHFHYIFSQFRRKSRQRLFSIIISPYCIFSPGQLDIAIAAIAIFSPLYFLH
jgi:hypothetical protein